MVFQLILPYWVIIFVVFIASFYWRWSRSRFVRLINVLPGPRTLPLIGNALEFIHLDKEGLLMKLIDLPRKYGAISRFWIANQATIIIASPELMKPILSSRKLITKSREYNLFKPLLSEGLLVSTGDRWKERRSLITPVFHLKMLEGSYLDVFNKKALDYTNQLESIIMKSKGNEIDVNFFIGDMTMDATLESLMSHPPVNYKEKLEFLHNLEWFEDSIARRILNPLLTIDSIFWLTSLGHSTKKRVAEIQRFTGQLIKNRREFLKNEIKGPTKEANNNKDDLSNKSKLLPFLDLLIKTVDSGTGKLTEQGIQEEVDNFIQAGSDTTASTMCWLLYCLARHPDEQDLVVNEIDQIFGNDMNGPCTSPDFSEMKYLECCIKETLRLYTSIPNISRELTEDVVVGNYTLPAGATVVFSIYGMHRNPEVFTDAESFKPERFLPEQSDGRHPYAFIPFSAGPRGCIGSKYAMLQMKTMLSYLLRNFYFSSSEERCQPMKVPEDSLIVIRPRKEFNLIVTKRASFVEN